jgi:hypothetical protein
MNRYFFAIAIASFAMSPGRCGAASVRMTFEGQMQALATDIQKALQEDPRIQGRKLAVDRFVERRKNARHANFGQRIEAEFRKLLANHVDDKAPMLLAGSYQFIESTSTDNDGLMTLMITVQILDEVNREIKVFDSEGGVREVNDTDDIAKAAGATVAPPTPDPANADQSLRSRNDAVKKAIENPGFLELSEGRIAAVGAPQWSIRVHRKRSADGPLRVMQPVDPDQRGLAFVDLTIGDYYEIELLNEDKTSDAVAKVTIDGLDVINHFSSDRDSAGETIQRPGYYIPAGGRALIRGWLHTVDASEGPNVFAFKVGALGEGAATAANQRGSVGVITAQFHEAVDPAQELSGRSIGETTKGEGLQQSLQPKPAKVGANALATVTVRYNIPEPNDLPE